MKKKCMKILVAVITLGMMMSAVTPMTAEAASARPSVSGSSAITRGKSAQYSVKYKKKRVSAKSCKWYSSKKSVAVVSRTGKVTAKKAGTTYIYVKYKGKTSAKKKVTVKNPVVPSVSGSSAVTKGKSAQFFVTYNKKRVSAKSCKWYSSKKSVAVVSRTGKVTAKKAGTTYIYVKYKGKTSAKKKVTVKNPVVPSVSGSSAITKGKSAQYAVTYNKKRVSAKSCQWYSSKKSVAVVSKTGKVTAKKAGTTYIYVKYKGKTSAKKKVVVKNPVAAPSKPSKPTSPAQPSKPTQPESKPDTCTKESDHVWEREPGGEHRYYETIVKEAATFCVCRRCGFINEGTMPSHHSSWTVHKVGPEIYRDDCDHTEPYKCFKCGKTKTEKWTEKGKETLRVYTVGEIEMAHRDPEACVWAVCPNPNCKADWHPDAWEKWNGVCFNCNKEYPEWRDNILYAWDYGDVYRDWDKNGKEMVYNPGSKTWEYTGR